MNDEKRVRFLLQKTFFDRFGQRGATAEEIAAAGETMKSEFVLGGFAAPPIPGDYAAFLRLADGYSWNGVRFFGTRRATPDGEDEIPALYEKNAYYVYHRYDCPLKDGCMVVGEFGGELFLYSAAAGNYTAVDEETMLPIEAFPDFEELFLSMVDRRYFDGCTEAEKAEYRAEL